jgi:hypothetical protein
VGLATPAVKSPQESEEQQPGPRSRAPYLVLAGYLLGAIYVTLRLWRDPASLSQAGDPHDVDQMAWFMRYSEHAIAHFHLPALVTGAMNAPHTVNLMWNTSLLLPGIVMAPVTHLFGPQVSLNLLLVIGFAGSAASMYFVLRRWQASISGAALGGALYGFSPALIGSGIGHYHLVLAILPPLMIDALLRIVTGRGSPVRNGLLLGVMASAQLFIGEEALIDASIAAGVLLVVLAANRPRAVLQQARRTAIGLGAAAVVGLVLCGRALWVQFHGVAVRTGGATTVVSHGGKLTHLYTIPYAFIVPSISEVLHTYSTARIASRYPQPAPEYLAYLGIPMIIVLLFAGIYYWRVVTLRVAFLTCVILEVLSLGAQPIGPYPGKLLPWFLLQHLPVLSSVLPDRLCILADGAAAVTFAFGFDRMRSGPVQGSTADGRTFQNGPLIAALAAAIALLPLFPAPYAPVRVSTVPDGYWHTFTALHLKPSARVLVVPIPNGAQTKAMRWEADTGQPLVMVGGDFIDASAMGRESRSGRAGMTPVSEYFNALWNGVIAPAFVPTQAQIEAQLSAWDPAAVVADTGPTSELGLFLIKEFGQPTTEFHRVLGWRIPAGKY